MHQKQQEIIPLLLGEQLHLDEYTHHLKINKTINYVNIYFMIYYVLHIKINTELDRFLGMQL